MPSQTPSGDAPPPKANPSTPDEGTSVGGTLAPLIARALGVGSREAPGRCSLCGSGTRLTRVNDGMTAALVCLDCLANRTSDAMRMPARFMALLTMPTPTGLPTVPATVDEAASCPSCGVTFSQVLASGLLGCADCYVAFRDAVEAGLRNAHTGA